MQLYDIKQLDVVFRVIFLCYQPQSRVLKCQELSYILW